MKAKALAWVFVIIVGIVTYRWLSSSRQPAPAQPEHRNQGWALAPKQLGGPSSVAQVTNKWLVHRFFSEMDGSKGVMLRLQSENEIRAWLESARPTLVIRCRERKTEVYVVTGTSASVESGEDLELHTVRLRFDQAKAVVQRWAQSTDGKALFSPDPKRLATQLSTADTLRFEFTPFNASPDAAMFNLKGLSDHLGEV